MIVDYQQGFKIWIGSDGQRFGCVMEENMLRESMHMLSLWMMFLQMTQHAGRMGFGEIQLWQHLHIDVSVHKLEVALTFFFAFCVDNKCGKPEMYPLSYLFP